MESGTSCPIRTNKVKITEVRFADVKIREAFIKLEKGMNEEIEQHN